MRNKAFEALDVLVGEWKLTMSDAWFLEPPGTEVHRPATVEWFGDAFLLVHSTLQGEMASPSVAATPPTRTRSCTTTTAGSVASSP